MIAASRLSEALDVEYSAIIRRLETLKQTEVGVAHAHISDEVIGEMDRWVLQASAHNTSDERIAAVERE